MDFLKELELTKPETVEDKPLTDEELKSFLEEIKIIGSQENQRVKGLNPKEIAEKHFQAGLKEEIVQKTKWGIWGLGVGLVILFQTLFFYLSMKSQNETKTLILQLNQKIESLKDDLNGIEYLLENPPFPENEIIEPLSDECLPLEPDFAKG